MNLLTDHLRVGKNTNVIELEVSSLGIIARLLHLYIRDTDACLDTETAKLTIQHLSEQTECVHLAGGEHGVEDGLTLPLLEKKELVILGG